jgi:RNA polymerase sigma factor (sigma-70 family)
VYGRLALDAQAAIQRAIDVFGADADYRAEEIPWDAAPRERGDQTMTASNEKGWFLDLHHTCDEVLVLFAREAGCQAARDELTCRCWGKLRARLIRCGPCSGLALWDLEDAQQQAFFWIQEAIRAFDPKGSSFQTFLGQILRMRMMDFCRSVKRRSKHFPPCGDRDRWPEAPAANDRLDSRDHPQDLLRHLDEVVGALDHRARAVWDEVRQGKRLCDLPQVLGVSYRTVKRLWRELRGRLTSAFRAYVKRQ